MKTRHPRLILATAALTAALAAASCGSPSLNEGLGSEEDLAPGNIQQQSASSDAYTADEAQAVLPELKELSGWELDIELPIDPRISIDDGTNSISEDSYMEDVGAVQYEAQVGMGWNGNGFEPIYENVLGLFSEPGHLNYAMWGFRDLQWGINVLQSVTLHGQGNFSADGGYYIAYPEYEENRWVLLGPYKEFGVEIPIEDDALISMQGHSYLAVLVYGGDSLQLRGFNVEVDSKAI